MIPPATPEPARAPEPVERLQRTNLGHLIRVAALFLLIAFFVHAVGHDIWRNLLGGGDGFTAGLPSKLFSALLSPWNPYVQLGQYAFANTQFQPFYPPGIIVMALFPNTLGYNLFILGHYLLAGLFFYLFARNLGLGTHASFLGGVAFMCSGFLLAHKGHQSMMSTAVWLPLILLFVDRFAASHTLRDAALAGVAFALSILAGFPQVSVYGAMIVVPYIVFKCLIVREAGFVQCLRSAAVGLITFLVFGCLLSSLQLFAVAETLPHITRQAISFGMFSEDSLPPYHLLSLFFPNIAGGFHGIPAYSSNVNVVETYPYAGLIPLFFSLFAWKRLRAVPDVRFWIVVAAVAAVLTLGVIPVQHILYVIPVYNLFRAPARHIYELNFALAALTAFAAHHLFAARLLRTGRTRRALVWSTTVFAVAFVAVLLAAQGVRYVASILSQPQFASLNTIPMNAVLTWGAVRQLLAQNLHPLHPTILYPLAFFLVNTALLVAALRMRSASLLKVILPIVLVLDVWSVYRTIYANPDTTDLYGTDRRPEIASLLKHGFERDHYRIYPVDASLRYTYPLLNMMYGISVINDYTPMWLRRYQQTTGFYLNGAAGGGLAVQQTLLSSLSAQYLLAREPGTIALLRSVSRPADTAMTPLPLPPLTCAALRCTSTAFTPAGTMSLRSADGTSVAIVHVPVKLQRATDYRVEFEARSPGELTKPLVVDLYASASGGRAYDSPDQDRTVVAIANHFARHTLTIDSGDAVPETGYLRIYTQSEVPVEIRSMRIGTIPRSGARAYTEVDRTAEGISLFRNEAAPPRFRFVTDLLPANNLADARQVILADTSFDPARQAVVEGIQRRTVVAPGRISGESIRNNFMEWRVETGARSFLVVGDSWFPGWTASVDEKPVDIQIVNGFTRGIFIEGAGQHTVQMRFWPTSLTWGIFTTILGLILLTSLFRPAVTRRQDSRA